MAGAIAADLPQAGPGDVPRGPEPYVRGFRTFSGSTDAGLVAITPNAEAQIALTSVQRIVDTPESLFVYVGAMQAFIVPRRRVSRGDVDIFVQELRRRVGAPA